MKAEQVKYKFLHQIIQWIGTDTRPNIEQISTCDYEESCCGQD